MENENPRGVSRNHPYKNNSPGRSQFRVGITHNFFSFSNNTNSLFPQQQSSVCSKQMEGDQFTRSSYDSSSRSSTIPMKRQPFQDLTANVTNRFIKLPSSCKIAESSVTLVPGAVEVLRTQPRLSLSYGEPMDNSPSVSSKSENVDSIDETSGHGSSDVNMSICEETASPSSGSALYEASKPSPVRQPDYWKDILTHWTQTQHRVRPRKYMEKQHEISYRMRSILIDWIVEVAQEFECSQETLFLAASIVDRFLSKMSVPRNKLQLIGTSSLFIACKYEEPNPPGIKDFVYITDDTYSKEQILRMELIILQALDFDLLPPTSYDFAKALCSLLQLDKRATHLAMYLAELALIDGENFTTVLPSLIGTSAVALGRWAYYDIFWDDFLCSLTPHVKADVQKCASLLRSEFYAAPSSQHKTVFEKYKSEAFSSVAICNHLEKLPWG